MRENSRKIRRRRAEEPVGHDVFGTEILSEKSTNSALKQTHFFHKKKKNKMVNPLTNGSKRNILCIVNVSTLK